LKDNLHTYSDLTLIYWIVLLRFGLRRYRRAILYLALLSLAAFAWDLANNHLVQFLNVSPSLRSQLSYFSFYILPLFILLFFSQLFQITGSRKQQNLLILCAAGYGAEVCLILFLYAFNILHLSVTLKAVHITDILLLLLVLLLCLREYRRTDDAMMKWSLLAFLLLFIGCTLNFVMFYTTTRSRGFSSGFRRGTMAFLLVLCVTVVRASMVEFGDVLSLEKYKHMAYIDHITGGNTKACFFEHLKDEAGHEAHWFLCVNFIGFKVCNEVLGFDDGDQLLSDLYKRTETFLEPGEIICNADNARFYLWLHDGTEDRLSERCVKIRKELPKCLDKYTSKLILDVNFYGYHAAPDEKEVNSIQNLAMMAYENPRAEYRKEASCWIYREECRRFSLYEKELEGSLKEGIENREFLVYLQPKCDPRTGVLKEAEALVRWQHPKYGMIPPDHYIDLFEKDGRIFELDLYVFRRTCEYISSWEKQGVRNPPVISANISKAAIRQDAFFSRYLEIIRETGVSTKYIQFEITESMSFDDKDQIKQLIRDIHTAGATCAMDDFGKSYSNLAILEELDFDVVKMDADIFRSGYPVVEDRRNFVTELIRFLKSIGKQVVAEGIETSTQVEALADCGCDLIQGYYFAKPLCFTDFEKFRSEHGQN
jgi:EAL domain-containing protein (putative c-di-GMP-specific phosphodiesterase class I)/GGDEF domain-containing protein